MTRALRVGIIGAGYWGEQLIRVFRGIPAVDMRVAYDSDSRCRSALKGTIETCDSVETLLQHADIDAVLVATPPSSHFAVARAVIGAGKHCWVEKPLAMRASDARELVESARTRRLTLFVDETFLYDPLVQQAKAWMEAGRLGRIYHLSFQRLGMGRIRRDSDVWWNSAPHDLSMLCYLLPGSVDELRVDRFAYLQPGIADISVATVRLAGGVSAHIYLSWLSPLKVASLVIVGSRGLVHYEGRFDQRALRFFDYVTADPETAAGNVVPIPVFEATETIKGGPEEPLTLAARSFVTSIHTGVSAPSAGEYSQRVVELLEAGATPLQAAQPLIHP